MCEKGEGVGDAAVSCCGEVAGLVKDLLELRGELWAQHDALPDKIDSPDGPAGEGAWTRGRWSRKRLRSESPTP
jgi:hypothetical protein